MVAKKVRTETKISEGSVSIGRAGVELVVQVLGELENSKALVVGAGEHGQLVANNLIQQHLTDLTFANRTLSRAMALSKELGGTTVDIKDIPSIFYKMDVIVSSIGGGQQIIHKSEVAAALKLRSYKPMIFIDLSVPRVFDIAIHDLEDAYLFDVDDLKGLTDETEQKRIQEANLAEGIINEEVRLCWEILHDNQYNRNIGNVFQKAQEIVESEVVRLEQQLDLSINQKEKIQKSMQSLVRKLYHHPIRHLHHLAKKDLEGEIQELLNILLGVESDEEE
jgi:glutamyl-tRNA reductase